MAGDYYAPVALLGQEQARIYFFAVRCRKRELFERHFSELFFGFSVIFCKVILNLAFCGGQLYRLIPYYLIEQEAAYREQQHNGYREHNKQNYYHGVHNSAPFRYSVVSDKLHYTGTKTKKQYKFNIKIKFIYIII